ncbi:MAG: hypothetical protein M1814_006901 [Vezdaea aestivalis]|nr:MAG: hypothetical protein M1814_006901 [Vezdaea aestivalis]
MSKGEYVRFLGSPSASQLHENATFHYITTLTTINGSSKILSHLSSKELKRTKQEILSAVEDGAKRTLAVEVETTLEFVTGAGAYLPGLDDNFLTDRVVTFPIIHFVHFSLGGQVDQIRLFWDQGSLLKQIEVIGARGRNWPIKGGPDLVRLIASAESAISGSASSKNPSSTTSQPSNPDEVVITSRAPKLNGAYKHGQQPTSTLFNPLSSAEGNAQVAASPSKSSMKPPERDYSELFPGNEPGDSTVSTPIPDRTRPGQNIASTPNLPKAGGGQNYKPSRLFEEEDENAKTPEKNRGFVNADPSKYKHFDLSIGGDAPEPSPFKVSPQKYNHFEFGDGDDVPKAAPATKADDSNPIEFSNRESESTLGKVSPTTAAKHQSQWNFADFSTPAKPVIRGSRAQDARHFGWSYEDDDEPVESPIKRKTTAHPRRDAGTHFTITDIESPQKQADRPLPTNNRSTVSGLYSSQINSAEGGETSGPNEQRQRPLSTVTNVNAHRKVFDSHFSMEDESPAKPSAVDAAPGTPSKPTTTAMAGGGGHKKAVSMMNANWGLYDQSPKENRGINTAGDGMGGRKGATTKSWGFGEDDTEEITPSLRDLPKPKAKPVRSENWDF